MKHLTRLFAMLTLVGAASAIAGTAPPTVEISNMPLFNGRGNVHPNLVLDLSVEYPTVGAAYRSAYNKTTEYLGYFNPNKCYTYPTTTTDSNSSTAYTNATDGTHTAVTNTSSTPRTWSSSSSTSTVGDMTVTTTTNWQDVVSTATYSATSITVSSGRLSSSAGGTGTWTRYYTTFNSTSGAMGTTKYYCSGSCGTTGSAISTSTKLYNYPQTATPATYSHQPQTSVTTTTAIHYPNIDESDSTAHFSISGDASATHECTGAFSGNFLNWATASSIDMLRYALTGGDRVVDTASKSVLQRAYLPFGSYNSNENFYAHSTYFPRRAVTASSTVSAPSAVTPFNVNTLYVVSCKNRILFSNTSNSGTNCDAARVSGSGSTATLLTTDKYFGEYLARVQVCDDNEGPTRTALCSKYGNNYKPEGDLQRYSDKIRAGAFGYLTEHNTGDSNQYGGVLRGPAKYVGPKKYEAPGFAKVDNDKPEWDSNGVFCSDPIGTPATVVANTTTGTPSITCNTSDKNSGVINYLNKFGRTNSSRLGAYKTWDPVSELYYESLRYLQGKGPTTGSTNATSAINALGTDSTDDSFPVYKTWVSGTAVTGTTAPDPIIASCQNNYIVVIGDVNTHRDGYIPGSGAPGSDSSRSADTNPTLNVADQLKKISAMEVTASGYSPPAGRNLTGLDTSTSAGSTYGTYNIAGLAYWANTTDIRTDKPVRVKTFAIDVDEGGNGSIEDDNPRGRKPRNSAFYLAAKYGGFLDKGDSTSSLASRRPDKNPFTTYDDSWNVLTNNAEWTGTATGTDPTNYFLASQPGKLIDAINNIFAVVSTNSGTISGVTLTSTKISTDSQYVYQPGFDQAKWSGTLLKLKITYDAVNNKVNIQDTAFATWDAGIVLTGKAATTNPISPAVAANPLPDSRKIYTGQAGPKGAMTTVEFKWGNLTPEQKTSLQTSPVSPYTDQGDAAGEKRLNYLRGSRADEIGFANGIFRARDRVLGDIINSNPTWYGAPATYVRGDDYSTFYDAHKNRTKAVYVGANDGMLHAFSAENGVELFAYVPNALYPHLNQLTDPAYAHRPYVDGQMNILEAQVNGTWKTILVSGFGGGAQGLFVLDVTDPANFASGSGAIWEFTDAHSKFVGNLMSPPVVAKFQTGKKTDGTPIYKNFVVVPSGYNNYAADSNSTATEAGDEGKGVLLLLSLDKQASEDWTLGTNYHVLKTPVSDSALPNGLGTPALVAGNDGVIRFAYAGDLQGNLWRFDFTSGDSTAWAAPSTPLFAAKDGSGSRQPITVQPSVVYAPGGGYVVLFGTGKFVETADAQAANFKTQSFYAIYDTTYDNVSSRSKLAERTLTAYNSLYTTAGGASAQNNAFKVSGSVFTYGTGSADKMGWFIDFKGSGTTTTGGTTTNGTGERSVTNPLVSYGNLFFNSLMTGSNPCETGGGRTYGLCVLSGFPFDSSGNCITDGSGVSGFISEVGMLSSPVLFDLGTTTGDRDSIGQRSTAKKYAVVNFGTGGSAGMASPAKASDGSAFSGSFSTKAGRVSWRELLNYDEMKNATK